MLPRALYHAWPSGWHIRRVDPWDAAPQVENPRIVTVRVPATVLREGGYKEQTVAEVRIVHWVDRCSEIDYGPEVPCPGYVEEHYGTEGKDTRRITCPYHAQRRQDTL